MIFNLILIILTIFGGIVMISAKNLGKTKKSVTGIPMVFNASISSFAYWTTIFITIKYIIELIRKK